jgi:CTD nuclear envelope phosphatase 1
MNSLNIVSRLGLTPPPSPPRSRSGSVSQRESRTRETEDTGAIDDDPQRAREDQDDESGFNRASEKTPLVGSKDERKASRDTEWRLPKRITEAIFYGVRAVLLTVAAPFRYVVACFFDEQGAFSAVMPLTSLKNIIWRRKRRPIANTHAADSTSEDDNYDEKSSKRTTRKSSTKPRSPSLSSTHSSSSFASSDGEAEDTPARNTRSKTSATHQDDDEDGQPRKSIRIKVSNDESLRRRKAAKGKRLSLSASDDIPTSVANALKSPSSAAAALKLTRYPRAPAPPRPLVPRRQPSYAPSSFSTTDTPRKTLIIDLDETLIHSMAKGGRMSTGHMVEVRLGGPVSSNGVQIGHGVPILYYVHERPGCHEFLRKVCKWYNLIVFTASVQEYADPVIDWLERERKYFSGRYYRQHCTFRNGAYIKDLAQVEPDLSRVMILDNSPMSYIFHEGELDPAVIFFVLLRSVAERIVRG